MTVAVRPQGVGAGVGAAGVRPPAPMPRGARVRRRVGPAAATGTLPLVLVVPTALMVAVLAFRLHEAVPSVSAILRPGVLFGPIGLVFMLFRARQADRARVPKDMMVRSTVVYLLWAAATIPTALFIGAGVETIKGIYTIVFITIAFALIPPSERSLDFLVKALALTAAAVGVFAVLQGNSWNGRLAFGYTLDANDTAAVMAIGTALSLGAARRSGGFGKLVYLACAAITADVVFRTGSRGGFLALLLTAAIFVLAVPGAKRMLWLGVASAGIVGFWVTAPQGTRDRLMTLTSLETDYNTFAYFGREEIWKRGVGYAVSNPLFGVGLGNFQTAEGQSIARDGWHGKWSAAHNAYIQVAAEMGIPGFIMFVVMMLRGIRSAFRWTTFDRSSGIPPDRARPELLAVMLGMAGAIYFLSFAYSWIVFAVLSLAHLADRTRTSLVRPRAVVTR